MSTEVFVRKASGLVREMSPYSAFAYNVLAIGILFPWVYLQAPVVFPQANIWIGVIITGVLLIPMWYTYSWLSASMPRSGGDYVFQTRILSGWIGFGSTLMGAFMAMLYAAFAGWMFCVVGAAPMFAVWGFAANNMTLLNIANWLASPAGVIIVSLIVLAASTYTLVLGMGRFVRVQWLLWYGLLASLIAIIFVFLVTSRETFIQNFNDFYQWAGVTSSQNFALELIDEAAAAGLVLNGPINWFQTIAVSTVAANSLVWAVLAVQQLGEIKGANAVRNTNFFIVGSGVFSTIFMALIAALLFKVGGAEFIRAVSYASWNGTHVFGVDPWLGFMASIAGAYSPVLVFLICFGFLCNAYQVMHNVMIQAGRIVFAAAVDRLFPDWLSEVNPRFRSPVNMHVVLAVMIGIWIVLYNLTTVGDISLSAAAAFMIYFALTCLSGALFPILDKVKAIYRASPINKLRLGTVAWITVAGALGAVITTLLFILYMLFPDLGVYNTVSLITIGASIVIFVIYYFIRRAYMKDRGIDVELAFKQLPPD